MLLAEALGWGAGSGTLPAEEGASGLAAGPPARLKMHQFPWAQPLPHPAPNSWSRMWGHDHMRTHAKTITLHSTEHWDRQQVFLP